jgi:membrane-bound serine protease (ClpP class)
MIDYLTFTVLLFAAGMILFAAEYFLPTGGFLVVAGVLSCVGGVAVVAYYGSVMETVAAVLVLCIGVPLMGGWAVHLYGKKAAAGLGAPEADATDAVAAISPDLNQLKGRYGRTRTPMRPAGAVEIDGRRVDAMTEGPMLEPNTWVKCIDVRAGTVIVRAVPKPPELHDFEIEDLK